MKTLKLLKSTFSYSIDNHHLDFRIVYDITGKVYEVRPLLYDLPYSAQQVTFGKNTSETKQNIENFINLVPLILPLGIMNQEEFFKNEFASIYKCVNKQLAEDNILQHNIYEYAERKSLAYHILFSNSNFRLGKGGNKVNPSADHFYFLIDFIQKGNDRSLQMQLEQIKRYYPKHAIKIISQIFPFIKKTTTKKYILRDLGNFKTIACRDYLANKMNSCENLEILSGIFEGLSKHKIDSNIQHKMIEIYNSNKNLSDDGLVHMMRALVQIPGEDTFNTGLRILAENRSASLTTAKLMLANGCPPYKIADIISPKLYTNKPEESAIIFDIYAISQLASLLPSGAEMLKIFIRTLEIRDENNSNGIHSIALSMSRIIQHSYTDTLADQILEYLKTNNSYVLYGTLILINCLLNNPEIKSKTFASQKAKSRYITLLEHSALDVVKSAYQLIGTIGRDERSQSCMQFLIGEVESVRIEAARKYGRRQCAAMNAVNTVLQSVPYNNKITNLYLEILHNGPSPNRAAALKGLHYSNREKLLDYLFSSFKSDKNIFVRRLVHSLSTEKPHRI